MMAKKILIVDDEVEFTRFLKTSLEERGYRVIETNSAIEGGLYLSREKPDLVIMDIKMRGINGFEACRAIRRNPETTHIPIFVVSALTSEEDIKEGLSSGANKYFTKPLNFENFLKETENFLK